MRAYGGGSSATPQNPSAAWGLHTGQSLGHQSRHVPRSNQTWGCGAFEGRPRHATRCESGAARGGAAALTQRACFGSPLLPLHLSAPRGPGPSLHAQGSQRVPLGQRAASMVVAFAVPAACTPAVIAQRPTGARAQLLGPRARRRTENSHVLVHQPPLHFALAAASRSGGPDARRPVQTLLPAAQKLCLLQTRPPALLELQNRRQSPTLAWKGALGRFQAGRRACPSEALAQARALAHFPLHSPPR